MTVRNTGARRGREVVQLYASRAVSCGRAACAMAGWVCRSRRERRRGRDRDDQRPRASVPALESGCRRLDGRAGRLPACGGTPPRRSCRCVRQSSASEGIPRQRATGVRRLTSPLRGGHRAFGSEYERTLIPGRVRGLVAQRGHLPGLHPQLRRRRRRRHRRHRRASRRVCATSPTSVSTPCGSTRGTRRR